MYLRIPSALPFFFAGLRVSSGLALIGAVVAEFVAGTGGRNTGLAYEILQAGFQLEIPRMYAALFLITVAGILLFLVMVGLSQLALGAWHDSEVKPKPEHPFRKPTRRPMLTTKQKVLRRFWYAVMPLDDLRDGPKPFRLLGERHRAVPRRGRPARGAAGPLLPPHRQALQGLVQGRPDRLRLSRLDLRPRRQARTHSRSSRCEQDVPNLSTPAYHCEARYGYAWVALDEPLAPILESPEEHDPAYRRIPQFYEVWSTSALRLMENSFDNAHFAFVHKGTFGQANQPLPEKYEIKETDYGFEAETLITVNNPPVQHRISGTTAPTTKRHMRNKWYMPFCRQPRHRVSVAGCATSSSTPRRRSTTARSGGAVALPQRHRGRLPGAGADRLGLQDHPRGQGHHRVRPIYDTPHRHEPPGRGAHGLGPSGHDHAPRLMTAVRGARREPRCSAPRNAGEQPSPRCRGIRAVMPQPPAVANSRAEPARYPIGRSSATCRGSTSPPI